MVAKKIEGAKILTKAVFNKLANKKENLGLTKGQFMNRLRMQGYTDREGNLIKRSPNDNDRKVAMGHYFVSNKEIKPFLDAQPSKMGRHQKTFEEHVEYLRSVGKNDAADRYVKLAKTDPKKAKKQIQGYVPRIKAEIKDPVGTAKRKKKSKKKFLASEKGQESLILDRVRKSNKFPYGTNPTENVYGQLMRAAIDSKNQGRIQFVTPKAKSNFDSFHKQLKEEIKAVGRSKPKMEKLMQKYKLKDTLARDAITGKEAGSFNIDTLEKFMENSVGIGLGKGSFAAARRPFAFRDFLKNYKLPDNELLNTRIARLLNIKDNVVFNVHHYDRGLQYNPYSSQVTLRRPNEKLAGLIGRWNTQRGAAGTPTSTYQNVTQVDEAFMKELDSMPGGIQTTSEYTGDLVGVAPTLDTLVTAAYKGANRSQEARRVLAALQANPRYIEEFKPHKLNEGGSVKKEYPSISLVKEEDSNLNYIKRNKFSEGGLIATRPERQSFSIDELKSNNKIGVLESMLAGVGSGLIQIPKGAFSLGASLLDLGFGTNNAAKVEKYFDDLTDLDEKAEKTFLGNMTQLLVNLGVPGGAAFKIGSGLTKKALLAKKNGNYFKMTDPKLVEKFGTALDTKGRIFATMGGGGAVAVSDMIFAGDVEDIGTLGDMFGGPTELLPNDSDNAAREVMNRIKFGVDGALLLGALGATGSALKTAIKRRDELGSNNEKIDYFLSAFRPRGRKTEEFFALERENIGLRQGDVNYASEVSRKLDKHIDAIFPYVKSPFNKMGNDGRRDFMKELNDTLLSGDIGRDAKGDIRFGPMSPERVGKITKMMRDKGAKQKDIDGVIDSFEMMRGGWGHMFTRLGKTMDDAGKTEFAELFSNKFRDYLGSTYEIFRNKSLIPLFNYKPSEQAVEKAIKMFQDSAELGGKGRLSREQAEYYVNRLVETARPAREIATKAEKTSGIYFNAPDFFLNKTTLSDIEKIGDGILPLDEVMKAERQIIEEVLGKVEDPLQTVLNGTNRLSMVTRRRQFYNTLVKEDADLELKRLRFVENNPGVAIPKEMRGFFRDTELEAVNAFGANVKKIEIDPGRTIEAGITDSLNGKYAPKGVAEAIEESAMVARDKSTLTQLYENFILYPKATSQLAKTVLSPITHVRNFLSASAFTTANGLIPGLTVSFDDTANAFKEAYRQLQIPGARQANDRYRELLRLGVVNNNVRLGDLQRLLNDVNFGETFSSTKALRDLMRPFSKGKKVLEDFYTAEDDFWKMTTFALERNRIKTARAKYGMDISEDVLDRAAADLVKNNVPNYDMVSEFIKGIRRVPFGNFVSFPAEIIRTSMNILDTAKREIFTPHTLDDGRVVYPFRDIGLKRLFGFTTTAVGVPTALTAGFSALYDVTEEELDALRRFVPDWSKNSTLIPIRGEDGKLKYIDFSHTNAYDTVVRPFRTMIKGVRDGLEEGELTENVIRSMIEATTETASPFIGESIWYEGMTDIFIRKGRTREGRRLWTDQTPLGDQMLAGIKHLGATQLPGSLPAFERLYQAATDTPDEYGREFEIPDEALGLFGFRAIEVDPVTAMKFKIADFSTGIRNARREFTGPLLRGGEISPEQVVDQFQIANNALYNVQNKMFKDYYAGRLLGATERQLDNEFADRVSNISLRFLKAGRFRPFVPSENIEQAFRDNALAIGRPNAYLQSREFLRSLIARYNNLPLGGSLPVIENPFRQILGEGITSQMSETTPQGLKVNLTNPVVPRTGSTQTNMNQTAEKGRNVFGATDPIFGS